MIRKLLFIIAALAAVGCASNNEGSPYASQTRINRARSFMNETRPLQCFEKGNQVLPGCRRKI